MAKKSDYLDPRTNLYQLLPEVFQSQTNEAIFEDIFNRYLSNPQIELVDGFAGAPLDNATQERQISEPTPHRQLFQLQPLLYAQVGNVDHLASYVDILNEIQRYGIDTCRLPLWGNALAFNWVPPIDIDKLVNFRNYYWYDADDPTSDPQYITIENPCIDATQRVEAYEETVDTFGDLQTIIGLTANTFIIEGDLSDVFTDGYVFFVTGSTNTSINLTYFTTASSTYDTDTDQTTITVDESISDTSTVDGDISLNVYLSVLKSQQNCACGNDVGWDIALWDNNQVGSVLWSSSLLDAISQPTEAAWATNNPGSLTGSPAALPPADLSIWYDTTNNQLKQYYSGAWNVVQNNFSAIVAQIEGTHFWDYTVTCDIESNPWTDENKWYHQNHVPNFAIAKRAQLPIIEYDFSVQLNRWTFTDYGWQYRESDSFTFAVTTGQPTLNELIPFNYVIDASSVGSPTLNKITISPEYGDQTDVFVNGYQFVIENDTANNGIYTVESSLYTTTDTTAGDELATVITVQETFSSASQSATPTGTCPTVTGSPALVSGGQLVPFVTSQGDFWQEYNEHWLLQDSTPGVEPATGKLLPVPSPPPTENPLATIDYLTTPVEIDNVGEYITSTPVDLCNYGTDPYVLTMQYTVLPTIAPGGVPAGTVIPLDPRMITRAPIGESVVRVVHNGQQVYGTFTELDSGIGGSPFYVGSPVAFGSPRVGVDDGFVDSITLAFDLEEFDTLTITVAEQAVEDIGLSSVPVRTIADDTLFAETGSPLGSQPETVSLIQYRRVDPLKTETNEYPLFDIFDCEGNPLFEANEIFRWKTDTSEELNADINLRIVGSSPTDYEFENLLIDPTDLPRPALYTYKDVTGEFLTVWRKGLNDEEYVPSYVDANGDVVTVGDPDGAWELADQLYYNVEHENRQYIKFPEFITHFRSILNEQNDFPGVILSGSQAYLQEDYNYGLGGHIKEHNDSFDTFLSSAFVNNVTPLGIIDFAHDQYENSLNTIKELYRRNLLSYLTDTSNTNINDFQGTVNTAVITSYELNDFFDTVYGDSNTFVTGSPLLGVRNWPATLPFVGLGFKVQPHVFDDETLGVSGLVHHDGHRSTPSLTATTRESVIQILLNTSDSRVTGETFGVQQSSAPPDLYSDLQQFITPRAGIYWYAVVSGVRTLYRFSVTSVAATPPSGVEVGSLWYDTSTDLLRELQSDLTWDPVEGSPSNGVITQAWTEIDFDDILIDLLLEVEQRLFEAAPTLTSLDFDVNSIQTDEISCPTASTTVTEADTAATYFEEAFSSYLRDVEIDDPYSAEQYYVTTDAFTWNYSASTVTTYPKVGSPAGSIVGGWWTQVYQELYGTPYPHLEPWVLQGYADKPTWWDSEYLNDEPDVYGTRRWKYIHSTSSPWGGMWENIRTGVVPAGRALSGGGTSTGAAGEAQTWNYFSVNIDNTTVDGFDPDELFPPFWNYVSGGGSSTNRSVFSDFATEIILPNADYTFETGGPVKFAWEISSQRLYDDLTVGFRLQPVRFMHSTFGVNFVEAGGLQINQADCKVYSHRDVLFHGDIVNTNEVVVVDGINQWYVNFNRYNGYDVAGSDFRPLWQNWTPQLTYQFGSIIDTETLQISNNNFDITERDYRLILKRSAGIDDFYIDAFDVKVLTSPNKLARYDTQHLWNFQVDTFFPTTRSISYYEVHNYPVHVDELNNTFTVYRFNIVDVDTDGVFYIEGDQTAAFTSSLNFTVASSTGNNGSHTATNISYNPSTDRTLVTVGTTLDAAADGYLTASYRTIPWETGDKIELTSSYSVPGPLNANTEYFVVKISDTRFQLASTLNDALAGRTINLLSEGSGVIYAGQIYSKFRALDGSATNRVWNHYVLDTRFTRSFVPPQRVTGMQNLINVVDGYAKLTEEEGWIVNLDAFELDPDSGRPITWNVELERFIDQAFRLPQQRAAIPDSYPVSVDPIADTFTFNNQAPEWQTGTKVSFSPGTGSLPTPLLTNQTYYVIVVDDTTIQVALTSSDALLGVPVNIVGGGSATISVFQTPTPSTRNPSIEINPFRNNLWVETPQGILSNVVDGPTDDIRNTQLITDQRRDQLTGRDVSVFRWDKLARIYIPNTLPNPDVATRDVTPYNTLHMASIQAFVDGYESIIMFNDYATDGTLIYDPFVGLNQARFNLQFFRQDEFTQRPAIGGYFLTPDDQIVRNIESSVLDLQNLYDTNVVLETTNLIEEGRRTLGYISTEQSFLDALGLNPKSKFLFWRGMIQNKGSVKTVDAFTNSVNLEGAVVDEYWAYKLADFGSAYEQEYPALNLFISDSRRAEKRLQFVRTGETAANTFEGISLTNQDRWHDQPDVLAALEDNNSSFYFEAEISTVESITSSNLVPDGSPATFWYYETEVPFDDVVVVQAGSPIIQPSVTTINSRLLRFSTNITLGSPIPDLRVYTICPKKDAQNPAKIIDIKDDYVVNELPFWDPRRGDQYAEANNVVTLESPTDPASYTSSLDSTWVDNKFWNLPEVGTTWWDISERDYLPYNDPKIFGIDDRIEKWGKLSDWASIKLYQWTESDVPPSEYDALAAVEELNISIDQTIRKTGRAKVEVFQRNRKLIQIRNVYPSTQNTGSPLFNTNTLVVNDTDNVLAVNDRVVFTTDDELPLPLQTGTFYYVIEVNDLPGSPLTLREIKLSEELGGTELDITPGALLVDIDAATSDPNTDTDPTGLVNDFDTAGFQDVSISLTKTVNSATGLDPGTSGFQDINSVTEMKPTTSTGLPTGETDGSSTIVYSGQIAGTGSPIGILLPDGWGASKTSSNVFVVSHPIGHTNYNVALSSWQAGTDRVNSSAVESKDANSFTFRQLSIQDVAGVVGPPDTDFIVAEYTGIPSTVSMNVTVDGGLSQTIETDAELSPTFAFLISRINSQLVGAEATLVGSPPTTIRITSDGGGDNSVVNITDVDLLASLFGGVLGGSPISGVTLGSPNFGTSTLYQTQIAVDGGGAQQLSITGDQAQTFGDLITALNAELSRATVSLQFVPPSSSAIRITSNRTGARSTVDIVDIGSPSTEQLFRYLNDFSAFAAPSDGTDATSYDLVAQVGGLTKRATIIGNQAQNWGELLALLRAQISNIDVTTAGDLLFNSGNDTISFSNTEVFDNLFAGSPLVPLVRGYTPQNTGEGNHILVPPFDDNGWVQLKAVTKNLYSARDNNGSDQFDVTVETGSPVIEENSILAGGDDTVDVYVNGTLTLSDQEVPASGLITITGTNPQDFITIRKERHTLTDEQAEFDPDVFDDGTNLIQYKEDYNYSTASRLNEKGEQETYYYFWVEDKTVRDRQGNSTLRQATLNLETIPTPYMIVDNLQPRLFGAGSPLITEAPRRYTQLILRGLAGVVDDQDRYVLRFTRDFTLRDNLRTRNYTTDLTADFSKVGTEPLDLKSLHTEWTLIREKQPFNIPRALWDKATEAMIAVSLTDSTSRVPSLSRELYDIEYDADTRYGLGDGQAFGDGSLFLETLLDDLQDPSNDFAPIDINTFFTTHDFTTEAGLTDVMDDIYNTFPFDAVNRLFFKFLQDALTTQPQLARLFKTSWVALQGTQIFQTEQLFTG